MRFRKSYERRAHPFRKIHAAPTEEDVDTSAELTQVANELCTDIALFIARKYPRPLDATEVACRTCDDIAIRSPRATAASSYWQDYLEGMKFVLNPLPTQPMSTSWSSDAAALNSDWMSVRSDLATVWVTISQVVERLEHSFNGEQAEREAQSIERAAERAKAGSSAAARTGDHTSRT
jgi:hypothetical protein